MIGRIFWMLIGVSLAIFVYTKIRSALRKASPEALSHRVAHTASGVGERAQDFATRVRAGMAERETEIRESLGLADPGH